MILGLIIVICAIAIGLYIGSIPIKTSKTLLKRGKIVKRPYDFYKQKHMYICKISKFEDIVKNIDDSILSEFSIEYNYDLNKKIMIFINHYHDLISHGSFSAVFKSAEMENEYYTYEFYLSKWKTNNDILLTSDSIPANILITMLEKILLKLDCNTKNKNYYMKLKKTY